MGEVEIYDKGEVLCLLHHFKGTCYQYDISIGIKLYQLAEVLFARVIHCKISCTSFFQDVFILVHARERMSKKGRGRGRKNLKQTVHQAWSPTRGFIECLIALP